MFFVGVLDALAGHMCTVGDMFTNIERQMVFFFGFVIFVQGQRYSDTRSRVIQNDRHPSAIVKYTANGLIACVYIEILDVQILFSLRRRRDKTLVEQFVV